MIIYWYFIYHIHKHKYGQVKQLFKNIQLLNDEYYIPNEYSASNDGYGMLVSCELIHVNLIPSEVGSCVMTIL